MALLADSRLGEDSTGSSSIGTPVYWKVAIIELVDSHIFTEQHKRPHVDVASSKLPSAGDGLFICEVSLGAACMKLCRFTAMNKKGTC